MPYPPDADIPSGRWMEWGTPPGGEYYLLTKNVDARISLPYPIYGWPPYAIRLEGTLPIGMNWTLENGRPVVFGLPGVPGTYRMQLLVTDETTENNIPENNLRRAIEVDVLENTRNVERSLTIVEDGFGNLPIQGSQLRLHAQFNSELVGDGIRYISWRIKEGAGASIIPPPYLSSIANLTLPNTANTRVVVDCEVVPSADRSVVVDATDFVLTTLARANAVTAEIAGATLIRAGVATETYAVERYGAYQGLTWGYIWNTIVDVENDVRNLRTRTISYTPTNRGSDRTVELECQVQATDSSNNVVYSNILSTNILVKAAAITTLPTPDAPYVIPYRSNSLTIIAPSIVRGQTGWQAQGTPKPASGNPVFGVAIGQPNSAFSAGLGVSGDSQGRSLIRVRRVGETVNSDWSPTTEVQLPLATATKLSNPLPTLTAQDEAIAVAVPATTGATHYSTSYAQGNNDFSLGDNRTPIADTYAISNLVNDGTYRVRTRLISTSRNYSTGDWSRPVTAVPTDIVVVPLAAPSAPALIGLDKRATIKSPPNLANTTRWEWRRRIGTGAYTQSDPIPIGTDVTDEGLTNGTAYSYSIRYITEATGYTNSDWSPETMTTPNVAKLTVPSAPTLMAGATIIDVFSPPALANANGWNLRWRQGTTGAWTAITGLSIGTVRTITGLTNDQLHQVQVRYTTTSSDYSDSDWSNTATATPAGDVELAAPAAPSLTAGDTIIDVSSPSVLVNATGWNLRWRQGNTGDWTVVANLSIGTDHQLTGLTNRQEHQVQAMYTTTTTGFADSPWSNTATATPISIGTLATPVFPTIILGHLSFTVSRPMVVTGQGNWKYRYRQGTDAWIESEETGATATVSPLIAGRAYEVQTQRLPVSADYRESLWSEGNTLTVTAVLTAPPAPTVTAAVGFTAGLVVTSPAALTNASGWQYRYRVGTGEYIYGGQTIAIGTNHTIEVPDFSTTYNVEIRYTTTTSNTSNSPWSAASSETSQQAPPKLTAPAAASLGTGGGTGDISIPMPPALANAGGWQYRWRQGNTGDWSVTYPTNHPFSYSFDPGTGQLIYRTLLGTNTGLYQVQIRYVPDDVTHSNSDWVTSGITLPSSSTGLGTIGQPEVLRSSTGALIIGVTDSDAGTHWMYRYRQGTTGSWTTSSVIANPYPGTGIIIRHKVTGFTNDQLYQFQTRRTDSTGTALSFWSYIATGTPMAPTQLVAPTPMFATDAGMILSNAPHDFTPTPVGASRPHWQYRYRIGTGVYTTSNLYTNILNEGTFDIDGYVSGSTYNVELKLFSNDEQFTDSDWSSATSVTPTGTKLAAPPAPTITRASNLGANVSAPPDPSQRVVDNYGQFGWEVRVGLSNNVWRVYRATLRNSAFRRIGIETTRGNEISVQARYITRGNDTYAASDWSPVTTFTNT